MCHIHACDMLVMPLPVTDGMHHKLHQISMDVLTFVHKHQEAQTFATSIKNNNQLTNQGDSVVLKEEEEIHYAHTASKGL